MSRCSKVISTSMAWGSTYSSLARRAGAGVLLEDSHKAIFVGSRIRHLDGVGETRQRYEAFEVQIL